MPNPPRLQLTRRALLAGTGTLAAGAAATGLGLSSAQADPGGVTLVEDGQSNAIIVTGPDASEQVAAAAQTLVDYVAKATGAVLPIVAEASAPTPSGPVQIHLGRSAPGAGARVPGLLRSAQRDGFAIAPTTTSVSIVGVDDYGTRFGVYDFLERYVGVRWLLPSEGGEHVPQIDTLSVPLRSVSETPDMHNRIVSAMFDPFWRDWRATTPSKKFGNVNRVREAAKAHHVLGRIFDPAVYANPSRPTFREDLFPIINGERHLPAQQLAGWQPRLTAPGTVDIAVAYSRSYLAQYPQFTGYSLSLNDDGDWSEDEFDQSVRNSLGAVHASEIYYAWVNEVAAAMERVVPDKACGVFAYITTNDPPSFRLHPNVTVYLTYDRYGWVDPVQRQRDIDHLDAWREVTDNVAWYDYAYGGSYAVPRMYLSAQASAYRHAASRGVSSMYVEQRPGWGEGPKPWATAKLLWNAAADPMALSREWCDTAVGSAAGSELFSYYQGWEEIWTTILPTSSWMRNQPRARHYIPFNWFTDPSYLDVITPELIAPLTALMAAVHQHAATPEQRARAEALLLNHALYEANVASYPRRAEVASASDALAMVNDLAEHADSRLAANQGRADAWVAIKANPILTDTAGQANTYSWTGWNFARAATIASWVLAHPGEATAVRTRIEELLSAESAATQTYAQTLQALIDGNTVSRGAEMDFGSSALDAWSLSQTAVSREEIVQTVGGVRVPGGPRRCTLKQTITDATPGYFGFELDHRRLDDNPTAGFACLELTALDTDGKALVRFRSQQFALDDLTTTSQTVGSYEHLPAGTRQARITVEVQGLAWDATLLLERVRFVQVA